MQSLTVRAASRTYDILIGEGLMSRAGEFCREVNPKGSRALLVTDSNVGPIYAGRAARSLEGAGYAVASFTFPAGEDHKRLDTVAAMTARLAAEGFTRSDLVVALGGGVTGDMAGFAAAIWLRGVDFVQIPTSLLAQVDSSVGGKTAVDIPEGKNLVGAFHQPIRVIADLAALDTLPPAFLADGMAEVIKAACIKDAAFFADLEDGDALSRERREDTVLRAVAIKRDVVERDETESGERKLLNFGHTLGHAYEKYYGYTGLSHGRAVAVGMAAVTEAAEQQGLTAPGTLARLLPVLAAYGLPARDKAPLSEVLPAAALDKKRTGGDIDLVLLREIGDSFLHRLPIERLGAFLGGTV